MKTVRQTIGRAFLFLGLLSLTLSQQFIYLSKAHAHQAGRLIDNSYFLDAGNMSATDIQNFLTQKNSGLKSMSFVLQCYGPDSKERQWYTAAGATCDTPIPASHIIYYAAQIYGISPKAILATLQKEQSLITTANPTNWQINQAMGYACPTSGSCGGNSTFPYQIDSGVWALRYHYERALGNMTWWSTSTSWTCGTEKSLYKPNLYPGQNVKFYDTNGTHYATVFIENAATSSLYCYTPHTYNNPQGLYGRAPYGTTGLYYSGSYNFEYYYRLWFGSPTGPRTSKIANVGANAVSVGGYSTSDGIQHVISLKSNGDVFETWWGYYNGQYRLETGKIANVGASAVSVGGYSTSDGIQHVISLKSNGDVFETWWGKW